MESFTISGILAFYIFLTAVLTSTFGSILGLGGSVLLVPLLRIVFNVPMHLAVSTGIIAVVASSCSSSIRFLKTQHMNIPLGFTLETMSVLGALASSILATRISGGILQVVFAILLFYLTFHMGKEALQSRKDGKKTEEQTDNYQVANFKTGMAASIGAGVISGMLGIGGGVLKVPIMISIMRIPTKVAVATSSLMVGITAAASGFVFFSADLVNPVLTGLCICGSLIGGQIGSKISLKISPAAIKVLFALLTLFLGGQMLFKCLCK